MKLTAFTASALLSTAIIPTALADTPAQTATQIRQIVLADVPALKTSTDTLTKARLLRNFVYSRTKVGPGNFTFPPSVQEFNNAITGKLPLVCGGMATELLMLDRYFSVPARIVQLATDGAAAGLKPNDTHVSIENYINNRWIIEDPTFNVDWTLNGKLLSYTQLANAFNDATSQPTSSSDGFPLIAGRTVASYYLPYRNLLDRMVIQNLSLYSNTAQIIGVYPQNLPPWTDISFLTKLTSQKGQTVYSADFKQGIPGNWGVKNKQIFYIPSINSGTTFFSPVSNFTYQLSTTNPITLPQGTYQIAIIGNISHGRIQIFTTSANTGKTLSNNIFDYSQFGSGSSDQVMATKITLASAQPVNIILANANEINTNSIFSISNITINKISN